jgi:hypothetical protein
MAGLTEFYCRLNEISHTSQFKWLEYTFKGIVQPFELGGESRLIGSAAKYRKPGKILKKSLMIQSHERRITPFSAA